MKHALLSVSSLAAAFTSCESPSSMPTTQINPLLVAEDYAIAHYPREVPHGSARAWLVEDHGDIWTVEMFAQNGVGGGIKMAIKKLDGRVIGSERTQ